MKTIDLHISLHAWLVMVFMQVITPVPPIKYIYMLDFQFSDMLLPEDPCMVYLPTFPIKINQM